MFGGTRKQSGDRGEVLSISLDAVTTTATAATAMATMSSHPWRPEWMGDGGEFDWRVWIRDRCEG
jgi:hypothetical protein